MSVVDGATRAELHRQMVRLAGGDRSAFDPVFRTLWPMLRGFVDRHLPAHEAQDVAQEALVKLFARAGELRPEGDGLAWALGIAAYEVRTARKRTARRREELVATPVEAGGSASTEDDLLARELEHSVTEVMGTLRPADARTLWELAHGERPAIPPATFRKRLERALKRFRLAWRAKHGAE